MIVPEEIGITFINGKPRGIICPGTDQIMLCCVFFTEKFGTPEGWVNHNNGNNVKLINRLHPTNGKIYYIERIEGYVDVSSYCDYAIYDNGKFYYWNYHAVGKIDEEFISSIYELVVV